LKTDWPTIANIATSFALLIAIGGLIWQIRINRRDRNFAESAFALKSALDSYERSIDLLADGNNDRVTWITAARIATRAESISKRITDPLHRDVFEVHLERYRQHAASLLGFDEPQQGAWFFYGSDNPNDDVTVAAEKSSTPRDVRGGSIAGIRQLAETSLATIYGLAEFGSNYEDPLKKETFEGKTGIGMKASFPGLYDYLCHSSDFHSVNGRVIRKKGR